MYLHILHNIYYILYIYDIIYTYLLRLSMSERAAQRALAL